MRGQGKERPHELLALFEQLGETERAMLVAFAHFLAVRGVRGRPATLATLRPAGESVMQAIKRLNASYPMLARRMLLQPVGALVSAHMLDDRSALETIDALERLYATRYREATERR